MKASLSREDPAAGFLERLLARAERRPERAHSPSARPDYEALATAELKRRFHERLLAAERAGAVEVEMGRRERRHLINRVRLRDGAALARHLGREPSSTSAARSRDLLERAAATGEPWVREILDRIIGRWSRGEPSFRLPPNAIDQAAEFLTLLAAISNGAAQGFDARTFSIRTVGETKAFERHEARIAAVMAARFGDPGLGVEAVRARLGLERYSHPVHLRGPVLVADPEGVLVDARARPFASIHADMLPFVRVTRQPAALLTIENYVSFNRQVREIDDGTLVVYTAGFASLAAVDVLGAMIDRLDASVPFFHWGDVDPGGLRIFRFLEETLPRPPRPHLMTRELAMLHGKEARPDAGLRALAAAGSVLTELAAWLASGDDVRHLEQEALDPVSPLSTGRSDVPRGAYQSSV
jgi:hypothetical protein